MLLWPHQFPNDRTVSHAGFWLHRSTPNKPERRFEINRTLVRWRRALKDLTTQIMARAGVDRATWVRVYYPLAKPMYTKGRLETQPIEEEEIPEDVLKRYRESQLYLPALTVGYVYDDRMDGHAKEAVKRWQATKTLLQLRGEASDPPTGQAS